MKHKIKKAYQDLATWLDEKDLLDEAVVKFPTMVSKVSVGNNQSFINEDGEVIGKYCSVLKKYFILSEVPFGAKEASADGFNSLSKAGANLTSATASTKNKIIAARANELITYMKENPIDNPGEYIAEFDLATDIKIDEAIANLEASVEDIKNKGFDTIEDLKASII